MEPAHMGWYDKAILVAIRRGALFETRTSQEYQARVDETVRCQESSAARK
jgi:hypothetical protein